MKSGKPDYLSVLDDERESKLKKKKQRYLNKMNGRLQTILSHFFFKWKLMTQLQQMSMSVARPNELLSSSHRMDSHELQFSTFAINNPVDF